MHFFIVKLAALSVSSAEGFANQRPGIHQPCFKSNNRVLLDFKAVTLIGYSLIIFLTLK